MDVRRIEQFLRDRAVDLSSVAHSAGFNLKLPLWLNFDQEGGKWQYCCAKYGGPGASVYDQSTDFHVTGKRLASEHSGLAVLFIPIEDRGPALGLCFGPKGEFLAFQAGYEDAELEILSAGLEELKQLLAGVGESFKRDAPALAGVPNPMSDLAPVLDEALSMAGVTGTRASILADAIRGAVERTVRVAGSNPFPVAAADTACSVFIATLIARQGLLEKFQGLKDELKASKQADKRFAALLKDHEKLKLASEGYRKRAERQAQDIVELQKKLKSARGVVPVSAPDDLANRLASLYGLPAS
jgi:hypothetical protein